MFTFSLVRQCTISESENWECPLCLAECSASDEFFPQLLSCSHRSCLDCLQQYLRIEISESRVNINCPECSEPMHPNGKPSAIGLNLASRASTIIKRKGKVGRFPFFGGRA